VSYCKLLAKFAKMHVFFIEVVFLVVYLLNGLLKLSVTFVIIAHGQIFIFLTI
jgi:hypothetical protein